MTEKFARASLLLAAGALLAQTAAPPAFEVASIKPAAAGRLPSRTAATPGRVEYLNVSLKSIVNNAYRMMPFQVIAPEWMDGARFDVIAKIPEGAKREQVPEMMQALLAERFQLKVHDELRDEMGYVLVVAKGGPKLKESAAVESKPGPESAAQPAGATSRSTTDGRTIHRELRRVTMAGLAMAAATHLQRHVADETGLTGRYDIDLDFPVDVMGGTRRPAAAGSNREGGPAPEVAPASSIFTEIQKLGLKLETRKSKVEYLIVDSALKTPTEN